MRKNISIILLLVCTIGFLWSCEKEIELKSNVATTENLAFIKIVHVAPNFTTVFKGADNFNVYVNGVKINGAALTYLSLFPVQANLYVAVPAGPQSVRITVNGTQTPDSITLASLNKTLNPGDYYSFIITDDALTANESRQMWIKDNFALTDTNNFNVRFVHAVLNDPAPVDIFSFQKQTKIFSNITPTTVTPFITLPYTILSDTLYVRNSATQVEIARINIVNGSTTAANRRRAYTLLYRGQLGGTGTKVRGLTFYANN